MTWAPTQTQLSIFTILSADATLDSLLGDGRIFDSSGVPENQAYPYVTLKIKPWIDRGNTTDEGLSAEINIDVWYRGPGLGDLKVQEIQKRIDELLHSQDICIDGWDIVVLRRNFIDILLDPDGKTKHGIQKFKLMIGEN